MKQLIKDLKPQERVVVAADFKPVRIGPFEGKHSIGHQVSNLVEDLKKTGVYIKVGCSLLSLGYDWISFIHDHNLGVFVDLKLAETKNSIAIDGSLLSKEKPEIVTVCCSAGVKAMKALKTELPETEVLGVTVPTSFDENDSISTFCLSIPNAVVHLARLAWEARIDGLVSSPTEIELLQSLDLAMSINTPGIRFEGETIFEDDQNQNRIMTPEQAIRAGADRIIVGRPIILANNPYDVVMRIIDKIARTLE